MSGPVQRSADVWRRAGAAVAGAPRELQSASKPRRRHTPPLRVALSPAEIPIKAGGGDARYSGAGAVLTESGACWSTLTVSAAVVRHEAHETHEAHEAPAHAAPPDPALGAATARAPREREERAGWQQGAGAGARSPLRRPKTKISEHVEPRVLLRFVLQ
ncbi:PREDICTED: uncharacterized protein LOC106111639 [Papilio polytes]|uniref:uncharacterized protein LOC106111639 n=1 Tax=Papilio polytes TaxID=76194 RepID=UPI00067643FE|nr:PREDICTED: uncharacterized protein LOC106111639 [Papilio polytes]